MKKGFTIAEMLGVVIILCLIAIIAFPPILNLVRKTENDLDEKTKELAITAASQYVTRNSDIYPKVENASYCISVKKLMRNDLISENTIKSTELSETNGVIINVTSDYKYEYEFTKSCPTASYTIGQLVTLNIGNDTISTWYVIENSDSNNSTVKLLKATNIDDNFYAFDEENRRTTANNSYCLEPQNGCNMYAANGTTVTEDSSIKLRVDEYGKNLNLSDDLKEVRLITISELENLGCEITNIGVSGQGTCENSSYSWVTSEEYWTMSALENSSEDTWVVYYDEDFAAESPANEHGIRPVIVVSKEIVDL